MFSDPKGPIEQFTWGKFVVCGKEHYRKSDGNVGKGKDIRVIGRDVTRWKERDGHFLTPEMITGIYDEDVDVLVLGLGAEGAIQCPADVKKEIASHKIELITARTAEACLRYNELYREGRKVALLAHGTC